MMKIAIPVESGHIAPDFREAKLFRFYDTDIDEIVSTEEKAAPEGGYESLIAFLLENHANLVICGSIGVRGVIALRKTSLALMGGASGEADDRVRDFLSGTLHFDRFGSPIATAPRLDEAGNPTGEDTPSDGNISACGSPCR